MCPAITEEEKVKNAERYLFPKKVREHGSERGKYHHFGKHNPKYYQLLYERIRRQKPEREIANTLQKGRQKDRRRRCDKISRYRRKY